MQFVSLDVTLYIEMWKYAYEMSVYPTHSLELMTDTTFYEIYIMWFTKKH